MKLTLFITVLITAYLVFCGVLIVQTGLFQSRTEQDDDSLVSLAAAPARNGNTPAEQTNASNVSAPAEPASAFDLSDLVGISAKPQTVTLGSLDPESGFKYELVLTSTGAAVSRATLSEFDDRNPDDPRPLILLSPLHNRETGRTLAVNGFETGPRSFPLGKLDWQVGPKTTDPDGARESVSFTAILNDSAGRNALKFTRTYRLQRDSYSLDCDLTVENLTDQPIRSKFQLQGPEGIGREGTGRDTRDIVAAFLRSDGTVESTRKDQAKLEKAAKRGIAEDLKLGVKYPDAHFLWAAVTNKYFTAIVRPVPRGEELYAQEIQLGPAQFVNPRPESQGEENISFTLSSQPFELSPAGADQASASFAVQLYLGSKDKGIFDKNELYDRLGYLHTINFMGCCCPQSLIRPLAFAIMSLMKWMYTMMGPLGNYGVVIMILVLLVRLLLHPITKKSQVNMMAMQKINSHPRMEEIKKKYAKDPREMQKQMWKFYGEQGVSPLTQMTSILPMFIQMPIWIALWSAVYASIDLRGAGFLPFWITDLSAPDVVFRFREITIPLVGWTVDAFHLLPILMGVFMYLQQKLMSSASAAPADSQMAQQQKMMMIMMPLMFPLMLYKGPSGVNLYIMSSMAAGVVEQVVIRKHIRDRENQDRDDGSQEVVSATSKTGGKAKKKRAKPIIKLYR